MHHLLKALILKWNKLIQILFLMQRHGVIKEGKLHELHLHGFDAFTFDYAFILAICLLLYLEHLIELFEEPIDSFAVTWSFQA
jgi:hypothetical protein|tara:strand:- start:1509 stop:1757 length:249 start_codon:yes stop_codon:yes gene_type:complete